MNRPLAVGSNPGERVTGPARVGSWDATRFYDLRNIYEARQAVLELTQVGVSESGVEDNPKFPAFADGKVVMLVQPPRAMGTHRSEQQEQWPTEMGGISVRKDTVQTWEQGRSSKNSSATAQNSPREDPRSRELNSRIMRGLVQNLL